MPVFGLIEHMIPVTADSVATEQSWESTALGNHLLRNHHLALLGFRFANDEFTNLMNVSVSRI